MECSILYGMIEHTLCLCDDRGNCCFVCTFRYAFCEAAAASGWMSHRNCVNWYEPLVVKMLCSPNFISLLLARPACDGDDVCMCVLCTASIDILHDLGYHCAFTKRFPLTRISLCFAFFRIFCAFVFVLFLIVYIQREWEAVTTFHMPQNFLRRPSVENEWQFISAVIAVAVADAAA